MSQALCQDRRLCIHMTCRSERCKRFFHLQASNETHKSPLLYPSLLPQERQIQQQHSCKLDRHFDQKPPIIAVSFSSNASPKAHHQSSPHQTSGEWHRLRKQLLARRRQAYLNHFQTQSPPTMVQFKEQSFSKTGTCYWKLGFSYHDSMSARKTVEYLDARGYKCRKSANKKVAIDAAGRYQRGLMSYEDLSMAELQSFCTSRGLSSKATTASRLARVLEKADDAATFPRFLELAPEIRNSIYELHFRDLDEITAPCRQPPLTLASSQLRAEALPLFYQCAKFLWGCRCRPDLDRRNFFSSPTSDARLLIQMPAAQLSQVKNFSFCLEWIAIRFTQRGAKDKTVNITGSDPTFDDKIHSTARGFNFWDDDFELQREDLEALQALIIKEPIWSWP